MNKFLAIGLIFILSCTQQESKKTIETKSTSQEFIKSKTEKPITYYKVNGKGILIGENINLLDSNYTVIKDISFLNEKSVEVTEVSDNFYKQNPKDDHCEEFKYVKIKTKDFEGIVDGRKIYEPIKSTQNKIVELDNNKISFITTNHFGIGVSDENGLTFCSTRTPVYFIDEESNYAGLIKIVKNKFYKDNYPYFELRDDDGANDEIENISRKDDKYLLNIKRMYQEGGTKLLVSIGKDVNGEFIAEILEDNKIKE